MLRRSITALWIVFGASSSSTIPLTAALDVLESDV
jgi:hypothetical protein